MGKKLSDVITLPVATEQHGEALRKVGSAFKAAYMATVALDESDEAVAALEEYSNKVDLLSENRAEADRMLSFAISTVGNLVDMVDGLLAHVPHAVIDCDTSSARQAERWCSENCVGQVDYLEASNACVVVFHDHADCVLFKVKFGV